MLSEITAEDILATGALGIRFTRPCLEGFVRARTAIRDVFTSFPG